MSAAYIVHLANYSDGVLYVLAFLFLLATAVMLDRVWFLRRAILHGNRMVRRIAGLGALSRADLEQLRAQAGRQPEAPLLETALRHLGGAKGEALAARLDESIMLIAPTLDHRLWVLDTIVTLAPRRRAGRDRFGNPDRHAGTGGVQHSV
jgi:biopolymer transport protein ExbB